MVTQYLGGGWGHGIWRAGIGFLFMYFVFLSYQINIFICYEISHGAE